MNINQENPSILLCGKSASGKDSLASYFKEQGYDFIISHTTRPLRENESEGNPYHFVSPETMQKFIDNNELIEYREYNTLVNNQPECWTYGIHKDSIKPNTKTIGVVDLEGVKSLKAHFGNRVKAFYIEVPSPVRLSRALERGSFDSIEWERRLEDDEQKFHWLKLREEGVITIPFSWQSIEGLYKEIMNEIEKENIK